MRILLIIILINVINTAFAYEFTVKLSNQEKKVFDELYSLSPNKFGIAPSLILNLENMRLVEDDLLVRFDDYLYDTSQTRYRSQKRIVLKLWNEFYSALEKYDEYIGENCMVPPGVSKKNQSWLDELINRFGREYVRNNIDTIYKIVSYLSRKSGYDCGKKLGIDIIYKEIEYQEYTFFLLNDFIIFLEKENIKKNNYLIKKIKNYNNLVRKRSSMHLYFDFLLVYSDKAKIPIEYDELLHFFTSHPKFQKPFNILAVGEEIRKFSNGNKHH